MTKADLVEKVAREAEMTKKDAEQLVEIIFDSITDSLNSGEKIELRGLAASVSVNAIQEKAATRKRVQPSTSRQNASPISNPARN